MSSPRLEIRLDLLAHNAATLVRRLRPRGIEVCAVTKATLGSPEVARVLLRAGASSLGDSRIDNLDALHHGGVEAPTMLIRGPLRSEIDRVVARTEVSCNSEIATIAALSASAQRAGRVHGVVLMVELGDLREGVLPSELPAMAGQVLDLPGVSLRGIGTNLACQSGVVPDADNMGALSALAHDIELRFGVELDVISGGNSANLSWALDPRTDIGRVNHLRLGESILLGREPLRRTAIEGLHTNVFTLVAEVIESRTKPSRPWGAVAQTAFGDVVEPVSGTSAMRRVIVAVGQQDTDPADMTAPPGFAILGASSDHLVLDAGDRSVAVGSELRFGVGYSALLRAMTSPFVTRDFRSALSTSQ